MSSPALYGVYNFRDFGGYDSHYGGTVTRGRLFRSAHLGQSRASDLETIARLNLKTVIDLRRVAERKAEPNRWLDDVPPHIVAHHEPDAETLPPHMQYLRDAETLSKADTAAYMVSTYAKMAHSAGHITAFSEGLDRLAEGHSPLLVHCAAGKDRTGLFVYLLHHILGVSSTDAIADYLLTNDAVNLQGIAEQASVRFAEKIGRIFSVEVLMPMVVVDEQYLQSALSEIQRIDGSLDNYLEHTLGIGQAKREAIREQLIVRHALAARA